MVNTEGSTPNVEDELALRIGRVARAHVNLDYSLRNVYRAIVMPEMSTQFANSILSTSKLIKDCGGKIDDAGLEGRFQAAARAALGAADRANETRNRVVHDMWVRDFRAEPGAEPEWHSTRIAGKGQSRPIPGSRRDIPSLDQARDEIVRADWRVTGIFWALHEVLPFYVDAGIAGGKDELSHWTLVMQGNFDLAENGGIRLRESSENPA